MLDGVRVLDLTTLLPGPYASMLLADLGAEVIKVESPLGDLTRQVPPFLGDSSAFFLSLNRSKRSLGLDVRKRDGAALFLDLVRVSDVVLEGFRPGRAERLGIGPAACSGANPRIVYCAISGYGQSGPDRGRAGHDLTYIARVGMLELNRTADEPPVLPPVQIADLAAGTNAALAVCAALFARERTGAGRTLDVNMLESALALMGPNLALRQAGMALAPGELILGGRYPFYNVYRAADGCYVALAAIEPLFWHEFCRAVGRSDLASQQFADGDARAWVFAELAVIFAQRTGAEWATLVRERDLSAEVVASPSAVLADPHLADRGAFGWLGDPDRGGVVQVGPPVRVVGEPPREMRPPPALGEGSRAILTDLLGMDEARIEGLVAAAVVFGPESASGRRRVAAALH